MKLISMTDFVLEQSKILQASLSFNLSRNAKAHASYADRTTNYANFLSKPLTLVMFVPCDDLGNIINKPLKTEEAKYDWEIYQQAKEMVLFENFEVDEYGNLFYGLDGLISNWKDKSIEQLLHKDLDITLTESAIKQLGL